jgi:hypothetical protein
MIIISPMHPDHESARDLKNKLYKRYGLYVLDRFDVQILKIIFKK